MFDSPQALAAAEYLMELMRFSPPDILSMSWYERVRPYAAGKVAMAYGYTLLAPYFELDDTCPAHGNTGYLPHPHGPKGAPIAPVGGYVLCVPSNLAADRVQDTVEALCVFTSPGAQKLYVQNGSRTSPRYSVGADPEVRRLSPDLRARRSDVVARRAAILAAPADPADFRDHRHLRPRASRHAPRHRRPRGRARARSGSRGRNTIKDSDLGRNFMDTERLKGKNILITGAARGMGAANAEHFAAQGANVCLGDIDEGAAQEIAERINAKGNGRAIAVRMDVTKREDNARRGRRDGVRSSA